jgi:hypothetical protein
MKKLSFFAAIIMLVGLTQCREDENVNNYAISIYLYNTSPEDIHMWITHESIGPNNKVEAKIGRRETEFQLEKIDLTNLSGDTPQTPDEKVTVYIGRNGVELGSKPYYVNNKTHSLSSTWNGTFLE